MPSSVERTPEPAAPVGALALGTWFVALDDLTKMKAEGIARQGWKITGVILLSENGKESCFVDRSAVRWLSEEEWWTLMHPPITTENLTLSYSSPNTGSQTQPPSTNQL